MQTSDIKLPKDPFFHLKNGDSNPMGLVLQEHGNTQRKVEAGNKLWSLGSKAESGTGREVVQANAEPLERNKS